jgi:hypothetical protein
MDHMLLRSKVLLISGVILNLKECLLKQTISLPARKMLFDTLMYHADKVGAQCSRDWDPRSNMLPSKYFTKEEFDYMYVVFESYNSNMLDYEPELGLGDDEMTVSVACALIIRDYDKCA